MKVTIERSTLLKALGHVQRVVERRTTIPILSNVLLRTEGDGLLLKATDLDLEVTEALPATVTEAGGTTLPAHTLHDIVRKLPDGGEVTLELGTDGARLSLVSGRSRFQLQCLPEADFPSLAVGDMPHAFSVRGSTLRALLERTGFAMSTEETRYYLNGVYVHAPAPESGGAPTLRFVSTDGHRLAQVEAPAPEGCAGIPGVILPRKAAVEVLRLVEDPEADVVIAMSSTKMRLTFGATVLTSKLIDGTFPDYTRVIPKANDKTLVVNKATFAAAVDRVSTISADRGRAVKVSADDNRLTLSVSHPDSGSAVEELDVGYADAPIEIGFNSRFLIEVVNQMETDEVVIRMSDPGAAVLVSDRSGSGALCVLMPMRI